MQAVWSELDAPRVEIAALRRELQREHVNRIAALLLRPQTLTHVRRRPPLAYTTVLTVLDRLHGKGVVVREKEGKAYRYSPRVTREAWFGERAARALAGAAPGRDEAVLLAFLDSTERVDPELLDKLSALIAARRGGRAK